MPEENEIESTVSNILTFNHVRMDARAVTRYNGHRLHQPR